MWGAEDKDHAEAAIRALAKLYGATFPKGAGSLAGGPAMVFKLIESARARRAGGPRTPPPGRARARRSGAGLAAIAVCGAVRVATVRRFGVTSGGAVRDPRAGGVEPACLGGSDAGLETACRTEALA